jgi:hypothetical protein
VLPEKVSEIFEILELGHWTSVATSALDVLKRTPTEVNCGGATAQQRLAMRQQRSVAFFEELKAKITQITPQALPSSKRAARQYAPTSGHG